MSASKCVWFVARSYYEFGISNASGLLDFLLGFDKLANRGCINSREGSSTVAPVATHPGRSGTYAEKLLSTFSITMA